MENTRETSTITTEPPGFISDPFFHLYRTVTERVTSKHKHRHQWCLPQFDGRIEEASFLLFTLRWFFTGISWFSEDHENLIPRKISVSLFWVHYLICFPTAYRQVSVYQGRVSIMYWRTVYMISIHRVMYKLTTWEPKFGSFTWPKSPFCFSCEISQKMDLNSDYERKG